MITAFLLAFFNIFHYSKIVKDKKLFIVYTLLIVIFIVLMGILIVLSRIDSKVNVLINKDKYEDTPVSVIIPAKKDKKIDKTSKSEKSEKLEAKEDYSATLYFVLDDVGNNLTQLKPFLDLTFPITVAVMPRLEFSTQSANLVAKTHHDLIMHQPMEAFAGNNPGPGAILANMHSDEVIATLRENLKTVPGAIGMNNHMGSKITADLDMMLNILKFLKYENLYFLDSVTSAESKAYQASQKLGLKYNFRNALFLDNEDDAKKIEQYIRAGLNVALEQGHAVMIGHVFTENLIPVLKKMHPELIEKNFKLAGLSNLFYGDAKK